MTLNLNISQIAVWWDAPEEDEAVQSLAPVFTT